MVRQRIRVEPRDSFGGGVINKKSSMIIGFFWDQRVGGAGENQ